MATIPPWLKGRHLSVVTITPQTRDVTGLLADGTAKASVARCVRVGITSDPQTDEISAVTSSVANNEITAENNTVEAEFLLSNDAASTLGVNNLSDVVTSDIFKFVWTRGTGTGSKTWTFYGTRGQFREFVDSKGRNVTSLNLLQVDIGSANPTYA